MYIYLLTFFVAFLVTYLISPVVRTFATKINAVDIPNDRKIHENPIPHLGGLAIYLGFFISIILSISVGQYLGMKFDWSTIVGILLGGTFLFAVGLVDDIKGLRPTTKLICQVLAALVVIYLGVEITFVSNPFNGVLALGMMSIPLTLLWVVGVTNAINLIDGLDGLATGVTAISSITLFVVALRTHQVGAAVLLLALFGASLGFLRVNFFPASMFLGDAGSMLLGFVLATTAIIGVLKTTLVVALLVPLLILGVPIFDTLFAILRRMKEGKHPFEADDKHIHHMLLRAGFHKREAVFAIYIVCFILSFIALFMALMR